eukprot:8268263-Pyramimonas_sp.AAC.2
MTRRLTGKKGQAAEQADGLRAMVARSARRRDPGLGVVAAGVADVRARVSPAFGGGEGDAVAHGGGVLPVGADRYLARRFSRALSAAIRAQLW